MKWKDFKYCMICFRLTVTMWRYKPVGHLRKAWTLCHLKYCQQDVNLKNYWTIEHLPYKKPNTETNVCFVK